jgi:hypothetical protein
MFEKPKAHVGALTCLVAILARHIESRSKKRWIDDSLTGAVMRREVDRLISHFAPMPQEKVAIPSEFDGIAGQLIATAENLYPWEGVPQIPPALLGDEWAALAAIIRDLGSGWLRNRAVLEGRPK